MTIKTKIKRYVVMPQLQKAATLFLEASNSIKYSPIPQLPIELAVVELSSTDGKLVEE